MNSNATPWPLVVVPAGEATRELVDPSVTDPDHPQTVGDRPEGEPTRRTVFRRGTREDNRGPSDGRAGTKAQNPMARFIHLLAVVTLCGCGPPSDSASKQSAVATIASDAAPEPSAFRWDKEMNVIWLDTRIRPTQSRRFDIGLGSITIDTLAVTENQLTFRYTPEIEGGYTVYECTVPISD
jgi:hypothetical protein